MNVTETDTVQMADMHLSACRRGNSQHFLKTFKGTIGFYRRQESCVSKTWDAVFKSEFVKCIILFAPGAGRISKQYTNSKASIIKTALNPRQYRFQFFICRKLILSG